MNEKYLAHHGIKGQKWGVRRYQNPDGTLTAEGRKKYSKYYTKEGTLTSRGTKLIKGSKVGDKVDEKTLVNAIAKSEKVTRGILIAEGSLLAVGAVAVASKAIDNKVQEGRSSNIFKSLYEFTEEAKTSANIEGSLSGDRLHKKAWEQTADRTQEVMTDTMANVYDKYSGSKRISGKDYKQTMADLREKTNTVKEQRNQALNYETDWFNERDKKQANKKLSERRYK